MATTWYPRLVAGLAAACLAFAGAFTTIQQYRNRYPPDFGWPQFFDAVHVVGVLCVLFLAAEVVRVLHRLFVGRNPRGPNMSANSHPVRRLAACAIVLGLVAAACSSDGNDPAADSPAASNATVTTTSFEPSLRRGPDTTEPAQTTAPTTTIDYLLEDERLAVPNQPAGFVVGMYGDSLFDSVRENVIGIS